MGGLDTEDGLDGAVAAEAAPPSPPPPDPMDPRRFGAMHAILAFLLVLFAQFAAGTVVVLVYVIAAVAGGADPGDSQAMQARLERGMIPLIIASSVATIVVTLVLVRAWAWHLVRDRSSAGLGLFAPPRRTVVLWAVLGAVLGVIFVFAAQYVQTDFRGGGPLAKVASSGGPGRVLWAVLAVFIAPPVEELLFRGLMLRGLIASWGVTAAGTIVTILFFVLHLFEAIGYWPGMIAILVLSIVTLLARLRTGSVVASTAVHAAYNATLAVAVYAT